MMAKMSVLQSLDFWVFLWSGKQERLYREVMNKQNGGVSFPHTLWSLVARNATGAKTMNGFKVGLHSLMKENSTKD